MKLTSEQFAATSRLFSSAVVRELARKGRSSLFARLARQSGLIEDFGASTPVGSLFEAAFAVLKKEGYRHEYIYKSALTHKILLGRHSLKTASMLTEFRVGECKADVAIFNGTSTVYEVKSERDSLTRLVKQVTEYATVFASVNVICSSSHVREVCQAVSSDVGICQLNGRGRISTVREATLRPERTSPEAIFNSIRVTEAQAILKACGISLPDVPNTLLAAALKSLFVRLEPETAHAAMVDVLRGSRNLLPLAHLVDQLPHSLQCAALSMQIRKTDHSRLIVAVGTGLDQALAWG